MRVKYLKFICINVKTSILCLILNTDKFIRNIFELHKLAMSSVSDLAALVVNDLRISSESQTLEDVHVDQSVESTVQAKEVVVVQRN